MTTLTPTTLGQALALLLELADHDDVPPLVVIATTALVAAQAACMLVSVIVAVLLARVRTRYAP